MARPPPLQDLGAQVPVPFVLRSPAMRDGFPSDSTVPPTPLRRRHSFTPDRAEAAAASFAAAQDPFQDAATSKVELDYLPDNGVVKSQPESGRRRRLVVWFAGVIVLLSLIVGLSAGLASKESTSKSSQLAAEREMSASSVASVESASSAASVAEAEATATSSKTSARLKTTSRWSRAPTSTQTTASSRRHASTLPSSTASPSKSRSTTAASKSSSTKSSAKLDAVSTPTVRAWATRSAKAGSPGSSGLSGSSRSGLSSDTSITRTITPIVASTGTLSAALLARSSSMTRAAVPTLPVPSKPLATSGPAGDYITANWAYIGGISDSVSEFVSFTADPYPGDDADAGMVLQVDYPVGSEGGNEGPNGGVEILMLGVFGNTTQERSVITYKVAFSDDFDFVNGGKLPGIYGGTGVCSGGIRNTGCFSARLMWRTGGTGEVYCYVPEYTGLNTDGLGASNTTLTKRAFGLSLNNGSFNFTTTEWNEITQVVVLNSDPGPVGPANGYLAIYHQGFLAFERSDLVYRTNASVGINELFFSTFFGGSDSSFWASNGGSSYFKDFQFFSSTEPSTTSAANVTATFPANQ